METNATKTCLHCGLSLAGPLAHVPCSRADAHMAPCVKCREDVAIEAMVAYLEAGESLSTPVDLVEKRLREITTIIDQLAINTGTPNSFVWQVLRRKSEDALEVGGAR